MHGVNGRPPKGAAELFRLWNAVPLRRIAIELHDGEPIDLQRLNDRLRNRSWRTLCAKKLGQGETPCADRTKDPVCQNPGQCAAPTLFPMKGVDLVTGEQHKPGPFLASLQLRWLPQRRELVAWLFGSTALQAEPIVLETLRESLGRKIASTRTEGTLASFFPPLAGVYEIDLVTDWILSRGKIEHAEPGDVASAFAMSVRDGLISRARKLTNTCISQLPGMESCPLSARMLIGFAAEYVITHLLESNEQWLITEQAFEPPRILHRRSERGGQQFPELAVRGRVSVKVGDVAAPLLGLLAVFGAGDSADKAYGSIELV